MLQAVEPVRESMTFSQYFDTNDSVKQVAHSFGYSVDVQPLTLAEYPGAIPWVSELQQVLVKIIRRVSLLSEISRREFLIAQIIIPLINHFDIEVQSEFTLKVSDRLQGNIDYLLEGKNQFVVIEAKMGDMARGFRQLVAEMIAVEQWMVSPSPVLYGAVSVGTTWQFCVLDRNRREITQNINFLNIPEDTESLCRVLIAILEGDHSQQTVPIAQTSG